MENFIFFVQCVWSVFSEVFSVQVRQYVVCMYESSWSDQVSCRPSDVETQHKDRKTMSKVCLKLIVNKVFDTSLVLELTVN